MSKFSFLIVVFAVFVLFVNAQCGKKCKFRFCKLDGEEPPNLKPKAPKIRLCGSNALRSRYICRSFPGGKDLGVVKSTGTASVTPKRGSATKINAYRPAGMSPKFPKDFFRLYNIFFSNGLQGVGRQASIGNQEGFLDKLCVVLPITSYEILSTDGSLARTISSTNSKDCIAFKTFAEPIVIEVIWDSSDDFGLSVEGPTGTFGFLIKDSNVVGCGGPPQGKETVVFNTAKNGEYMVTLAHFNNCGGTTRFTVNVIVNCVRVQQWKGRSSVAGGIVLEVKFTV